MKIYNFSPKCGDDSPQCPCCLLVLLSPAPFEQLDSLQTIEGVARPCETVQICIDGLPPITATADNRGYFSVQNPYTLTDGAHTIWVRSCCDSNCCTCATFYISSGPVPVPTIETPECGSTIADSSPAISGLGVVGNSVRVCIEGYGCQTAVVDENGEYHVNFGVQFPDGEYSMTVTQIDPSGRESTAVLCSFTIETSAFLVDAIDARMGRTFRTIDIDVRMSGTTGTATIYYLLLPPGSAAPTAAEIMNYNNTAALLDGSAATGQFTSPVTTTPTLYTWSLTGLNKPGLPAGTTGVVDGYRYDVYIYVVSGAYDSGVLTFPSDAVMGMPFATGLGTADNPFTIRDLSDSELALYPDLLANNPLNRPGVDENARQLENIERLITLYEETDGYYGLEDSMDLNYLMTSDIDLSNYAGAYGGAGWESIGDIDGWINERKATEHLFSGVFDGAGHTITNLSITPTATDSYFVGYRGLFGGVENGTIKNLALTDVTIDAFTTTPGFAQIGSFISTARSPVLTALSLTDADITADCDTVTIGDTHAINIGGFVGAIFDSANVSDISGLRISIVVPSTHALALGGFVGYTDKFSFTDSYDDIALTSLTISGYAMAGGFAGYLVYGTNSITNTTVSNLRLTAPGGQAGGLIGLNLIYDYGGPELIERCTVQNSTINSTSPTGTGRYVGGLIGSIERNTFPILSRNIPIITNRVFPERRVSALPAATGESTVTISRCSAADGQVSCDSVGGGLIGFFHVSNLASDYLVQYCNARQAVSSTAGNIGGLIGYCQSITVNESFANGHLIASVGTSGGLFGSALFCVTRDNYATNALGAADTSGGIVGQSPLSSTFFTSYYLGNISADSIAGGIAGTTANAVIRGNLVLGGGIYAPTAHRILGLDNGFTSLQSNYALSTVTPIPPMPNPNSVDGGSITSAEILTTMQALGWDTMAVWDTATIATLGRPTLIQNPE